MSTDEEIREAFHARLAPALATLTVDPALVSQVRRRHRRQQRLVTIGAPLGVAALAAGSIGVAAAIGGGGGNQTVDSSDSGNGPSTTLLGHPVQLPEGWTIDDRGESGSGQAVRGGPGTVVSRAQSIGAYGPDGKPSVMFTVLRNHAGSFVRTPPPKGKTKPAQGSAVCISNGPGNLPAGPSGAAKRRELRQQTATVGQTGCDTGSGTPAQGGAQVRYTFANDDELTAIGTGMTRSELSDFVHAAIGA